MRLPFRSIEWNAAVSRLLTRRAGADPQVGALPPPPNQAEIALQRDEAHCYYVLPRVPSVGEPLRGEFRARVPRARRIETVAACQHTAASLERWLREGGLSRNDEDRILIVGGNGKGRRRGDSDRLTSPQAIEAAAPHCTVWAVANPNNRDPAETASVTDKLQAGATGIITQPLLTSRAAYQLEQYSHCCDRSSISSSSSNNHNPDDDDGDGISFVVGLAFPQTLNDLQFWFKLVGLGRQEQEDDTLIKDHVAWFRRRPSNARDADESSSSCRRSLLWIQRQLQVIERLASDKSVRGVHCMPMGNVADLLAILDEPAENEEDDDDKARQRKRKKDSLISDCSG